MRKREKRGTRTSSGQCLGCPSSGHLARPLVRIVLLSFSLLPPLRARPRLRLRPHRTRAARDRGLRALVEIGASSTCLNGDTFVRAASHGGKTDLSAPTFLPGLLPPALFPAVLPMQPRSSFYHLALSLTVSLSLAPLSCLLPSHPRASPRWRTSRILSYTRIFHFSMLPQREKRRIVPCRYRRQKGYHRRDVKKFDSYPRETRDRCLESRVE